MQLCIKDEFSTEHVDLKGILSNSYGYISYSVSYVNWMFIKRYLMKIYRAGAQWHFTWECLSPTTLSSHMYIRNIEKNHLAEEFTQHQPKEKKKRPG